MPEMARPNLQSGEGIFDCYYFFHHRARRVAKSDVMSGAGQGTRGGGHAPVLPVLAGLVALLVVKVVRPLGSAEHLGCVDTLSCRLGWVGEGSDVVKSARSDVYRIWLIHTGPESGVRTHVSDSADLERGLSVHGGGVRCVFGRERADTRVACAVQLCSTRSSHHPAIAFPSALAFRSDIDSMCLFPCS